MHIFVIIAFLLVTVLSAGAIHLKDRLDSSERHVEQLTQHLDSKSGGTAMLTGEMFNYNLKTFDSGLTWYAIEYDNDWGVTILGEVEEIYPGLLQHLEAMDELTKYVEENGPIRGMQSGEIKLLEDAGFEVKERD